MSAVGGGIPKQLQNARFRAPEGQGEKQAIAAFSIYKDK